MIDTYEKFENKAIELIKEGDTDITPWDKANISDDPKNMQWGYMFKGRKETEHLEGFVGTHLLIKLSDLKKSVDEDFIKKYMQSEKGRLDIVEKWKEIAESGK